MDTPQNTLLVVLQMVSIVLALLMILAVQQVRQRQGVALWVAAYAAMALTQLGRELFEVAWGFRLGRTIGHFGGPLSYALLYIGIRVYLGLVPRVAWSLLALAVAAAFSLAAVSAHQNYVSLATTTCFTALFQALTAAVLWGVWRHEGGIARIGAAATEAPSSRRDAAPGRVITASSSTTTAVSSTNTASAIASSAGTGSSSQPSMRSVSQ